MVNLTALPGLRRRLLPFDVVSLARSIVPALNCNDHARATEIWLEWRACAIRTLNKKGVDPAVRDALIKQASSEVRAAIMRQRGTTRLGTAPSMTSAKVIAFPKVGGANA